VRSWTTVDYYLRRTPAFWYVKRALSSVHLVLAEEEGEVRVFGINDSDSAVSGSLEYGIFALKGTEGTKGTLGTIGTTQQSLSLKSLSVVLAPNASTVIARFPAKKWTKRKETMAFAVLRDGSGNLVARNRLFDHFFCEMAIVEKPAIRVTVKEGVATFESPVFVQGVCLDLDGETRLADNFFDLFPGQPYSMAWPFTHKPKVFSL